MSAETADGPRLHAMTEDLASGANFATITTLLPSGRMQAQTMWVHAEDGQVVLNTETQEQRHRRLTACSGAWRAIENSRAKTDLRDIPSTGIERRDP